MSRPPLSSEFISPYNAAKPPQSVICMDERFALKPDSNFPHEPYLQTGGGAHGVAQDWMVGKAIDTGIRHGEAAMKSLISGLKPVHHVAGLAAQALGPYGVILKTHEECAAEILAEDVASSIATVQGESKQALFDRAHTIDPEVRMRDLEIGTKALTYMLENGLYTDLQQSRQELAKGVASRQVSFGPVERVTVSDKHVAEQVLVNHRPGTIFNTHQAWEAGLPAYHIGLGGVEQRVRQQLTSHQAVSYRGYRAATVLRHSGILPALPAGANGKKPVAGISVLN